MHEPEKLVDFLRSEPLDAFLQLEALRDERGRISRAQKAFGPMASFALEQLHVRSKAVAKAPYLYRSGWLFTQRSLEQCTSEAVARVKSLWLRGSSFTDLTTGAGVDAFFASRAGMPLFLAEQDPLLRSMLVHNFRNDENNLNIVADGMAYVKSTPCPESAPKEGGPTLFDHAEMVDAKDSMSRHSIGSVAYLDPDRRPGGRRTYSWHDSLPNVIVLMPRLMSSFDSVWVKSSPMTDPTESMRAWDGHTTDVFAICWQGELKELLFRVQRWKSDDCRLHAVYIYEHDPCATTFAIPGQMTTNRTNEGGPPPFHLFTRSLFESTTSPIYPSVAKQGDLLFEPHAGLKRLNLSTQYAAAMGYTQMAPHIPYFLVKSEHTPRQNQVPGRLFRIRDMLQYQPKTLVRQLKSMGISRAMMASKGFFLSVAQLRSTLNIPDGADAYLIFTTLAGRKPVCIVADLL